MPKLLKCEPVMRLARRRSNGLPMNTAAPKAISDKWCPALSITASEAPSIFHEPTENYSGQMVVWSGRGPLTTWPERDWSYILKTEGFDVIWDLPPLTSSELWTRWMGQRHSNDNDMSWTKAEAPKTWDEDRKKKFDQAWAKISPLMERAETEQKVIQYVPKPPTFDTLTPERAERVNRVAVGMPASETCEHSGKIKHRSKLWALQHRLRLAQSEDETQPERLEVYKCQWCGGWHVGHRV